MAVVRTIINKSVDLGISTVAEGVETSSELELIKALGCDFYQGYLLARPLPGAQLAQLLRELESIGTSDNWPLPVSTPAT